MLVEAGGLQGVPLKAGGFEAVLCEAVLLKGVLFKAAVLEGASSPGKLLFETLSCWKLLLESCCCRSCSGGSASLQAVPGKLLRQSASKAVLCKVLFFKLFLLKLSC